MRAKIRLKIKRSRKTKKSEIKEWDIGNLIKKEVEEKLIKEVTTDVQNIQLQAVGGNTKCATKYIKKRINEAAGKIIENEERPQTNSLFDEEFQIILEDTNRA